MSRSRVPLKHEEICALTELNLALGWISMNGITVLMRASDIFPTSVRIVCIAIAHMVLDAEVLEKMPAQSQQRPLQQHHAAIWKVARAALEDATRFMRSLRQFAQAVDSKNISVARIESVRRCIESVDVGDLLPFPMAQRLHVWIVAAGNYAALRLGTPPFPTVSMPRSPPRSPPTTARQLSEESTCPEKGATTPAKSKVLFTTPGPRAPRMSTSPVLVRGGSAKTLRSPVVASVRSDPRANRDRQSLRVPEVHLKVAPATADPDRSKLLAVCENGTGAAASSEAPPNEHESVKGQRLDQQFEEHARNADKAELRGETPSAPAGPATSKDRVRVAELETLLAVEREKREALEEELQRMCKVASSFVMAQAAAKAFAVNASEKEAPVDQASPQHICELENALREAEGSRQRAWERVYELERYLGATEEQGRQMQAELCTMSKLYEEESRRCNVVQSRADVLEATLNAAGSAAQAAASAAAATAASVAAVAGDRLQQAEAERARCSQLQQTVAATECCARALDEMLRDS
eukprot:gnl/TRDRNA2_/TRDRNA2_145774_c0_seq1.p1 gnl/TRDRNA2_/TRDRNA2_145774_c0~~gnl/TRDRNA2_/TRDRNA2_145774_c0_seq1.p1  ORF type:complete len:549 (-),score=98.59 gnl/TRDRNA2_/TRDRNA2_145774_c0_seq1:21-1601(-)